jgi:hypothetical protein
MTANTESESHFLKDSLSLNCLNSSVSSLSTAVITVTKNCDLPDVEGLRDAARHVSASVDLTTLTGGSSRALALVGRHVEGGTNMGRIKSSVAVAVCALAIAVSSGGPALAGEVVGSGKKENQNQGTSWCSFSGLNDEPDAPLDGSNPEGPGDQGYGTLLTALLASSSREASDHSRSAGDVSAQRDRKGLAVCQPYAYIPCASSGGPTATAYCARDTTGMPRPARAP